MKAPPTVCIYIYEGKVVVVVFFTLTDPGSEINHVIWYRGT